MKRILLTSVLVLAASSAYALINGTPHDFGSTGPVGRRGASDQTCKYCHVPHNAKQTNLLWSRGAVGATVVGVYDSNTMDAATAATAAPQSLLCLSCHNATPSLTNTVDFTGGAITATKVIMGATGTDVNLTDDHPIGFVYNAALATADKGLTTPTVAASKDHIGATGAELPLFGGTTLATMECATCHAVHGAARPTGAPGAGTYIQMFLRTTNAGSTLCLKCHTK